jgi:hypothetical protein
MPRKLINEMTPEEKKAFTSAGGKASGESRRKQRDIAIQFQTAMDIASTYSIRQIKKKLKEKGLSAEAREQLTQEMEILKASNIWVLQAIKIVKSAKTTSGAKLQAAQLGLEHTYGKPKQKTELELNKDLPAPIFNISFTDGTDNKSAD